MKTASSNNTENNQYKLIASDEQRNQEFKQWEEAMVGDGLNEANSW